VTLRSLLLAPFSGNQVDLRRANRLKPTGRERMGSPTLQTLQDPILRTPWVFFRVAFQTLAR
jgi:hypothetical protein